MVEKSRPETNKKEKLEDKPIRLRRLVKSCKNLA
jgi:hypothetical protein